MPRHAVLIPPGSPATVPPSGAFRGPGLSRAGVAQEVPAAPLTTANDRLRRARLRAAAGYLGVTLCGLFVWRAVSSGGTEMLALHAAIVAGLGASLWLLGSQTPISSRGLRVVEVVVFGLAAAYLSAHQYDMMVNATPPPRVAAGPPRVVNARAPLDAPNHEAAVVSAVKKTLIGTILLTFAYCMLIPNTWREAARVAAAVVAVPVFTELALCLNHPDVFDSTTQFANATRVGEDVVIMLVAAGLSVYGTHVINTLRTEAFEAHELNQYRLAGRLGTGGMGEVYLAEHQLLKRPCALKLIRPASAADPASLTRFEREVRATAALSHPNIVEIYDYGRTADGTFFYVMEYLRGLSLDELVKRHGPMPVGRVIYLVRQVADALAEAHEAGLIHRDVKPANVYACRRGGRYDVVKLLDFGLVKAAAPAAPATELSREGVVRGTPLYMAPEQITGSRQLDHRCDLYALGAVAYVLLTGRPPFEGDDSALVMTAQVRDPVAPPRLARPDVPEDLERVVLRCLAKWPESRYPDAASLTAALDACAAAADWDDTRASRWWHEFEADAIAPQRP